MPSVFRKGLENDLDGGRWEMSPVAAGAKKRYGDLTAVGWQRLDVRNFSRSLYDD